MKITETKTVTEEREVVADVRCNQCGASCFHEDAFHGLVETTVVGGYYSPVLPDGTKFTFSLCEACLGKMFSAFKIQPHGSSYLGLCMDGTWTDGGYRWPKE